MLFLSFIDYKLNCVVRQYIDIEVERMTNNIVNRVFQEKLLHIKIENYMKVNKDDNGIINNISYDTNRINEISNMVSKKIEKAIINMDDGIIDKYFNYHQVKDGKFKNMKNGILCEVSFGTIRNSLLFSNVSPSIPIKLSFLGQVTTDVEIKTKEYGINNVMVEVFLIVRVKEQVSMPISSKRKTIIVKHPIYVDLIKGEVPKYYGGYVK